MPSRPPARSKLYAATQVRLSPPLRRYLEAIADRDGVSISQAIRGSLEANIRRLSSADAAELDLDLELLDAELDEWSDAPDA